MENETRRSFDVSKIGSPLHFFSFIAYIVSISVLLIGVQVLSSDSLELAWVLIVIGLLLLIGVTIAVFVILRTQHWALFSPTDLTREYINFCAEIKRFK